MNYKLLAAIFVIVVIATMLANYFSAGVILDAAGNPTGTVKGAFSSKFPTKKA